MLIFNLLPETGSLSISFCMLFNIIFGIEALGTLTRILIDEQIRSFYWKEKNEFELHPAGVIYILSTTHGYNSSKLAVGRFIVLMNPEEHICYEIHCRTFLAVKRV